MLIYNPSCNQCDNKALYRHISQYVTDVVNIHIEYSCDEHKCLECEYIGELEIGGI